MAGSLSQYRDWAVGWTTGARFLVGEIIFRHRVQTGFGAHFASYSMGTGNFTPGIKRPEREAHHSPHLIPRERMRGVIPPLHWDVFME
jgi:hypothetical protein